MKAPPLLKEKLPRLPWPAVANHSARPDSGSAGSPPPPVSPVSPRVEIPVSWSIVAKPPAWGSMPVMRCSLSVQAAGPRRRRRVSRSYRSGGTRPLRRFQERSQRASSVASSWSQLSLTVGGAPHPIGHLEGHLAGRRRVTWW